MTECSKCTAPAIEVDAVGVNYCQRHWQGSLEPGAVVVERLFREVDGELKAFWVHGKIKVIKANEWRYKLKPLKSFGFIYVYKPSIGQAVQVQRSSLMQVRPNMPKVFLNTFAEVFGTKIEAAPRVPVMGVEPNLYIGQKT